jgi:Predicted integral membrane protein (DUF2269)
MSAVIELYTVVLFLHVLGAVAFIGPTLAYLAMDPIVDRAGPDAQALYWRLRGAIGTWVITGGGTILLLAGIYLAVDTERFEEWWVGFALLALVVLLGVGGGYFAPTERKLAEAAEGGGAGGAEYRERARRLRLVGWIWTAVALIVLFLMVTQPS